MTTTTRECAWCGADQPDIRFTNPHWYPNRRGEWFCNPSHRSGSNRALRRLLESAESGTCQACRHWGRDPDYVDQHQSRHCDALSDAVETSPRTRWTYTKPDFGCNRFERAE